MDRTVIEKALSELDEKYIESFFTEADRIKTVRKKRVRESLLSLIAGALVGVVVFALWYVSALAGSKDSELALTGSTLLDPVAVAQQIRDTDANELLNVWEKTCGEPEYRSRGILFIETVLGVQFEGGQIGVENQEQWVKDFSSKKESLPTEFGISEADLYGGLLLPKLEEKASRTQLSEEENTIVVQLGNRLNGHRGIAPLHSDQTEKDAAVLWLSENKEFINQISKLITNDAVWK